VTIAPGLYTGTIRHRRFSPRQHAFTYSLFMALIDVDAVARQMAVSRLTACNRFGLASFHDADHIGDPQLPLRERIRACARQMGQTCPDGPIYLLTHLRYAGYVFNPISIYYCCDTSGAVAAVLADVRNTYGGRRSYWLNPADTSTQRFRSFAEKALYVSPFMTMDANYEFVLTPPGESLVAHMNVSDQVSGARLFDATLQLERRDWTAANIRRTLLGYPFMTARVMGGIHLEALRLRLKRLPEYPNPTANH